MKILYHHRIRSKDGQFVHLEELTDALKAAGHSIFFVGPGAIEKEDFGADAGLVAWLKAHLPRALYEVIESCYAFFDLARLIVAIVRIRPDCIYERYNLFLPSGVWAKKLFGLPLLLEVNAPLFDERNKYDGIALKSLASAVERFTWRGADFVLPVTEVLAEIVASAGVDREHIRVIPNGINATRFANVPSRKKAKEKLGLQGKFVLGFAGFVRDWHGMDRVLDYLAANEIGNEHLLLVGDGPAREDLLRQAERLGIGEHITITGIVSRENVADYLAAFDIALQPNVVAYASPLKLFEYLALGHAIVAPDSENITEILVDEENSLLFEATSEDELFACISRLRNDSELRTTIGNNARATIEQRGLTWAENANRVVHLFNVAGVASGSASRDPQG